MEVLKITEIQEQISLLEIELTIIELFLSITIRRRFLIEHIFLVLFGFS
jgi:hypothetical protein